MVHTSNSQELLGKDGVTVFDKLCFYLVDGIRSVSEIYCNVRNARDKYQGHGALQGTEIGEMGQLADESMWPARCQSRKSGQDHCLRCYSFASSARGPSVSGPSLKFYSSQR